jgi:hypothetical protein
MNQAAKGGALSVLTSAGVWRHQDRLKPELSTLEIVLKRLSSDWHTLHTWMKNEHLMARGAAGEKLGRKISFLLSPGRRGSRLHLSSLGFILSAYGSLAR